MNVEVKNEERRKLAGNQLQEEYKLLITRWDDFDRRALSIKGWVAVGMLVVIANADKIHTSKCASILVIVITWIVEAIWRVIQGNDHKRIIHIEEFFSNKLHDNIHPFQIATFARQSLFERFRREYSKELKETSKKRQSTVELVLLLLAFRMMILSPSVFLPYAPFILLLLFFI